MKNMIIIILTYTSVALKFSCRIPANSIGVLGVNSMALWKRPRSTTKARNDENTKDKKNFVLYPPVADVFVISSFCLSLSELI